MESVLVEVPKLALRSVALVVPTEKFDGGRRGAVGVVVVDIDEWGTPIVLRASMLRPVAEETEVDMRSGIGVRCCVGLGERSAARWLARRRSRSRSGDGEPSSETMTQEVSPRAERRLSSRRPPVTVRLRGERSSEPAREDMDTARERGAALCGGLLSTVGNAEAEVETGVVTVELFAPVARPRVVRRVGRRGTRVWIFCSSVLKRLRQSVTFCAALLRGIGSPEGGEMDVALFSIVSNEGSGGTGGRPWGDVAVRRPKRGCGEPRTVRLSGAVAVVERARREGPTEGTRELLTPVRFVTDFASREGPSGED